MKTVTKNTSQVYNKKHSEFINSQQNGRKETGQRRIQTDLHLLARIVFSSWNASNELLLFTLRVGQVLSA